MSSRRKVLMKVVVLGESGVGKTSLLERYVDNKFSLATKSTIGAGFLSKHLEVGGQQVTLQIWDTCGQERFQGLGTTYYRGSDGAMFVFDVCRQETFDAILQWRDAFLIQVGEEGNHKFPILIVANKIDREDRIVTGAMIEKFRQEHNFEVLETSARDSMNVGKAFERIAEKVISSTKQDEIKYEHVGLELGETKKPEGPCCN